MPDPYAGGLVKGDGAYWKKVPVSGRLVAVLKLRVDGRGLELIKPASRAVIKGDVHELMVTDEQAEPGRQVNRVAYLAFFEVLNSGIILRGDEVIIGSTAVGSLAGFDLTHFPNHLNIVLKSEAMKTGQELALNLGATIQFSSPAE